MAMCEVQSNICALGDLQAVLVALHHRAAVIAMVRAVVTAAFTDRPEQRDDLIVVGIHGRRVRQPGRQADRAVVQPLRDESDHLLKLVGCRRPLLGSQHLHPHVAVRHEVRDIDRRSAVNMRKILRDRSPLGRSVGFAVPGSKLRDELWQRLISHRGIAQAVLAENLTRDTLPDLRGVLRIVNHSEI